MDHRAFLRSVGAQVREGFERDRTLLSFEEWLSLFTQEPARHARGAAQYVVDAVRSYGTVELEAPAGPKRRFRIFDAPYDEGVSRVAGQEGPQAEIVRVLENFARAGRANKLLLLHGPNGSAKSSLVRALVRGVEAYSRTEAGALYRFAWIFPAEKLVKGSIGFGGSAKGGAGQLPTFAHLEPESIDARIPCEAKDHPLVLIPSAERKRLLTELLGERGLRGLADAVVQGEPCAKCREIQRALLQGYQGDWLAVLRHVQVERFEVSQRYQQAAVTIEPQVSVDAGLMQLTADRSVAALPAALQNVELFRTFGPLVQGNRGLVEFDDLLKRPFESYKYLLGATETGVVPLEHQLLHLDVVFVGTANDKFLDAFKQAPDWPSFKGRFELVRVPYLRRARIEQEIYDAQLVRTPPVKHLAPHATFVAAQWGVLTRLEKPEAGGLDPSIRGVVDALTPLEKAALYDDGRAPDRLPLATAAELRKLLPQLWEAGDGGSSYEGATGASARELKTSLQNAAQRRWACLTPFAVLEELEALARDGSVHEFLRRPVIDGYHDALAFLPKVEELLLDRIDAEVREALGLVQDRQYDELFERYVVNVSHWVKGEKVRNRVTGAFEPADEQQMLELEKLLKPERDDRAEFRRGLIGAIGAWKLDHPDDAMEAGRIFPDLVRRLREHYYEERKRSVRRGAEQALQFLSGERSALTSRELAQQEESLSSLRRVGYCEACAKDAIAFLLRRRYS